MNFESSLQDAFASNRVATAVTALIEEKCSNSLVNRLDKIVSKELDKKTFKNVNLLLRAIESVAEKDEDCLNRLVQQVITCVRKQPKLSKTQCDFMEVFFDVSMNLCRSDIEGRGRIQDLLLLRVGAVVIDADIPFSLRLEAVRTINTILDSATKEDRRKLCQSLDYGLLQKSLAKVIIDVGDYEMQVAISEALCRMTMKKSREEFVRSWFGDHSFTDAFTAINDREFETDCRIFLNELNTCFGESRRVVTFPCIRAFLDCTELFMPEDPNLEKFWVDFNIGTSCISFFVNDPEGSLWESINLAKAAVSTYSLRDCDDQKILTLHMTVPMTHAGSTGKMVQIIFDSSHDIQTALWKVFEEKPQLGMPHIKTEEERETDNSAVAAARLPATPPAPTEVTPVRRGAPAVDGAARPLMSALLKSRSRALTSPKKKAAQREVFCLQDHSDTEVTVENGTLAALSGRSRLRGPEPLTFTAALWRYQVMRAKARLFCQSASSNGSSKSLPVSVEKRKTPQKRKPKITSQSESDSSVALGEGSVRKETPHFDYSRKKAKVKSKLKVLPLSSPSSDESYMKGPLHQLNKTSADSGFRDKTLFEETLFQGEDQDAVSYEEEDGINKEAASPQRKRRLDSTELFAGMESGAGPLQEQGEQPTLPPVQPRRLFPSSPLEDATETMAQALREEEELETELGAGVIAAFHSFKAQLREHFSSRYKKIEMRSLQSLTDCQQNVTSLLTTVHNQRLVHLERFQNTVVQQLGRLEHDCLALQNIEQETVSFWRSESHAVRVFCERQQNSLDSLALSKESSGRAQTPRPGEAAAATEPVTVSKPDKNVGTDQTPMAPPSTAS